MTRLKASMFRHIPESVAIPSTHTLNAHRAIITAENVIEEAKSLEIDYGDLWDNKACTDDAKRAIYVLKDYSEGFGWRHHRAKINELIRILEEDKEISLRFDKAATEFYEQLQREDKHLGGAGQHLKYVLIHSSGFYTDETRDIVRKEISADIIKAIIAKTPI